MNDSELPAVLRPSTASKSPAGDEKTLGATWGVRRVDCDCGGRPPGPVGDALVDHGEGLSLACPEEPACVGLEALRDLERVR